MIHHTLTYILGCLAAMLLCLPAYSQTEFDPQEETDKTSKHALGVGAGVTTGMGLLYRFTPNRFAAQATILPSFSREGLWMMAGASFFYTLKDYEQIDFFLYQGNRVSLSRSTNRFNTFDLNNGLGFGVEITILKHLGLSAMTGMAAYDSFDRYSMTGECGLYFKL